MTYENRIAAARQILEAHNEKSTQKIDIELFFTKLTEFGGTSEEALSAATWEDLQDCGLPRILARQLATSFRAGEQAQPQAPATQQIVIVDDDPIKKAQKMSIKELLAAYNPRDRHDPVYERLSKIGDGHRFVVFDAEDKVDVETSVRLFDEIADFGEKTEVLVGDDPLPRPVYKVGERPTSVQEHCLFPGRPLRPGGISDADFDWSYDKVPLDLQQVLYLAVNETGELDMDSTSEADVHREASTMGLGHVCKKYRKAAALFREQKPLGKAPSLRMILGRKMKKQDPFGVNTRT